jgi:hypothetical protein
MTHNLYQRNAEQLRAMYHTAVAQSRRVNGYTAAQLDEMATRYEAFALNPAAAMRAAIAKATGEDK